MMRKLVLSSMWPWGLCRHRVHRYMELKNPAVVWTNTRTVLCSGLCSSFEGRSTRSVCGGIGAGQWRRWVAFQIFWQFCLDLFMFKTQIHLRNISSVPQTIFLFDILMFLNEHVPVVYHYMSKTQTHTHTHSYTFGATGMCRIYHEVYFHWIFGFRWTHFNGSRCGLPINSCTNLHVLSLILCLCVWVHQMGTNSINESPIWGLLFEFA